MPIRHGLTMGELAKLFNGEKKIGADLTVIAMRNWRRDEWFDETGLALGQPVAEHAQPATRRRSIPASARSSPTNLSVGRGTDTPFEQVGAPWIDGVRLADALNARRIPGVRFYPVRFTPTASTFANQACQGVFIVVTDRQALRPVRMGVELASALVKLFPGQVQCRRRRPAVRIGRRARADQGRRRRGGDCAVVGGGRSTLAPAAREIRDLSMTPGLKARPTLGLGSKCRPVL